MKKVFIIFSLLLASSLSHAQISIYGRGSNITGIIGIEAQIGRISIAESWRPITEGVQSYITTVNYFFRERNCISPYLSLSYSSKAFAYQAQPTPMYYDLTTIDYAPGLALMVGGKSVLIGRLSGRAAAGYTFSNKGECFAFEMGINFIIFEL